MSMDLWRPIIASVFRHVLTVVCGVVFAKEHDNEIAAAASLVVALVPIGWGAINARRNALRDQRALAVQKAVTETY
jgi:uncharacterized membrane protein